MYFDTVAVYDGPWIRWTIAGTLWDSWHRIKAGASRTLCGIAVPVGERVQEREELPSTACAYCRPLVLA